MQHSSARCDLGKLHSRKEMFLPSFLLGTIEKIALAMPKDFHSQRGGKAHVQSQWERANFHPNYIKIPTFFKFQIDVYDYVPETYTSANFHFNPFSGASLRIGGILSFVTFFWLVTLLYCIFSWARAQIEPVDGFFSRLMAHTTCFRPRTVLWGYDNIEIHFIRGNIHQKFLQKGREWAISSQTGCV